MRDADAIPILLVIGFRMLNSWPASNVISSLNDAMSVGMGTNVNVFVPLAVLILPDPGNANAGGDLILMISMAMNIGNLGSAPGLGLAIANIGDIVDPETSLDIRLDDMAVLVVIREA